MTMRITPTRSGPTRSALTRTLIALAGVAAVGLGALSAAPALAQAPKASATDPAKVDKATAKKKDQIIFKTGRQVEGVILEETETTVRFLVIFSDTLRSESTYPKGDILEIKRDAFKTDPAKDDAKDKKDDKGKDGKDDKKDEPAVAAPPGTLVDVTGKAVSESALKVYVVTLGGDFGRDVSKTPVKRWMEDVVRVQPDVVVVRFEHAFTGEDGQLLDFAHQGFEGQVYQGLETARELDTLIMDRVRDDPAFKKKPRMVAWVKKALGTGAFLPFVFPEIYFTSDGYHGGIGGLDLLFKGVGDEVAQRKQQSLRLSRAIGLAEKGGHDGRIMRAMTWSSAIFSYRIVGGQVEFLEDEMPPNAEWFVLKDDGLRNELRRDSVADRVRLKGNDLLTLDARTAFDIGFSRGTADTVEELLSKMGVTRDYAVVKNKSKEIFGEWSRDIRKAERDALDLIRKFQSVEVRQPGGFKERTAARSQQKTILRQLQSVVEAYKEGISAERLGAPEELITQIHLVINRIETAQRLDRPEP